MVADAAAGAPMNRLAAMTTLPMSLKREPALAGCSAFLSSPAILTELTSLARLGARGTARCGAL